MRRLMTLIAVAASLLLVATAVPAAAKKGGEKGPPDREQSPGVTCTWAETTDNPDFPDGPYEWNDTFWGTYPGGNPFLRIGDFTETLDRDNSDLCLDIKTTEAGQWHLTLTPRDGGAVRAATIVPRDAVAPGDSCGGEGRRGSDVFLPWTLPHPDDPRQWFPPEDETPDDPTDDIKWIPAATVNACAGDAAVDSNGDGHVTWDDRLTAAEWGGFGEWVDGNDNRVVDFDLGEKVMTFSDEVHPLVLLVFTQGLKKGSVDVCVDLPPFNDYCGGDV